MLSTSDLRLLEEIESWEPLKGDLSGIVPVKQVALQYYPTTIRRAPRGRFVCLSRAILSSAMPYP